MADDKYAISENPENGIYPFEIIDLATNRIVARTSSREAAQKCLDELNSKGFIEIDL
jgi:hypothetical protein